MNINDFNHLKQYRIFESKINDIGIFIPESQMSDEVLVLAEKILQKYPLKISRLAEHLSSAVTIVDGFEEEFTDILYRPCIIINKNGGTLYYSNNEWNKSLLETMGEEWVARVDEGTLLYSLFSHNLTISSTFIGALEIFGRVTSGDARCQLNDNAVVNIRHRPGMYVGSLEIEGVYHLIFDLIETAMQSNDQLDVLIKISLLENDVISFECDNVDNFVHAWGINWLDVVKVLSDIYDLNVRGESCTYFKGELLSQQYDTDTHSSKMKLLFRPDKELFSYEKIVYLDVFSRLKELAQLNSYVTFHLANHENKNIIHFEFGLEAMLKENSWSCPEPLSIHFIEDGIEVFVSMTCSNFESDVQLSYVNNLRTYDGIFSVFKKYIENNIYKDIMITKDDAIKGVNFVIHVKLDSPQFMGAVKRKLGNPEVRIAVKNGMMQNVYPMLESEEQFKNHIKYITREYRLGAIK